MAKTIRSLDDLIRDALSAEEREGLEDPSAFELLAEVFRGRHRFYAVLGVAVNVIFFTIGVGAAVAFVNAQDLRTMLLYAGVSALSFGVVLAVKFWYWLEMTRLALTREIKRVELQVALIGRRMQGEEAQ